MTSRLLVRVLSVAVLLLTPLTVTVAAPGVACACSCATLAPGQHPDAAFIFAGTVLDRTDRAALAVLCPSDDRRALAGEHVRRFAHPAGWRCGASAGRCCWSASGW